MAEKVKNSAVFFNPLSKDNPVIVQVLGICSALAVTAKLEPAIVMGISVIAVLAFSSVIISLIRKTIPVNIRIILQLVVVAPPVISFFSVTESTVSPPIWISSAPVR